MAVYNNPIVLQRADPWVLKVDGEYYFTGSDPEYNCIAIRHASNINDLQKAPETVVCLILAPCSGALPQAMLNRRISR